MDDMEWWGYNSVEGWVVLDRSIPCNRPAIKDDLLFHRCSDWTTFQDTRERWNPPLYRFAPNYLKGLKGEEATQAAAELEAHKAQWPEVKERMRRAQQEAAERLKAEQAEQERQRKKAARELKKQLGLQS